MSRRPNDKPTVNGSRVATSVRWMVLCLACCTSWTLYLHRYTWNVIRPELAKEYELSNTALEGIFTVFNFGYAAFQIPGGIACDLFGAHLFLGLIMVAWSLLLPLLGVSGNLYALGGVRLLFGVAQAGAYPSLGQVTQTWFPRSIRTSVQGWVASFFGRSGGAMASILMATVLMGYFGLSWRISLIILSAGGVVFALSFLALYRNRPDEDVRVNQLELDIIREGENLVQGPGGVLPFRQVLKDRNLQILAFQQFMNAGADIVYTSVMGSYFLSKGIGLAQMGLLVSLPLWGGAIGGVVGGYLNDWLIRRTGSRRRGRAIVGVTGKIVAACVLLVAITQREAVAAGIALFIVKFFSDWTQPTVWGACTDMGGRYAATVFSIINTAGNVGALLTPLVIGPLLDIFTTGKGDALVTDYTPMFFLMAVMYVIGALCWLAIDCSKPVVVSED